MNRPGYPDGVTQATRSNNSYFQRGQGAYRCSLCGRRTRHTGVQSMDAQMCPGCFKLAGMDDECNDNGRAPTTAVVAERDRLLANIGKRGGDVVKVRDANPYLFPDEPKEAA